MVPGYNCSHNLRSKVNEFQIHVRLEDIQVLARDANHETEYQEMWAMLLGEMSFWGVVSCDRKRRISSELREFSQTSETVLLPS